MTKVQRAARRPRSRRGEGDKLAVEIIQAARDLVEETGSETGATLQGIARRVGIAAPSIYDHFPGIDAIRQAMVNESYQLFASHVADALRSGTPAHEQLRSFLTAYLDFGRLYPTTYRLLFIRGHPSPVPETHHSAFALIAQLLDLLAQSTGLPRESPELFERGIFLWLDIHGIVALPPSHPRFPWPDEERLIQKALDRTRVTISDSPLNP